MGGLGGGGEVKCHQPIISRLTAVARLTLRQMKIIDEAHRMSFRISVSRSQVKFRSNIHVETGLIAAASTNLLGVFLKGGRKCHN